MGIEAIKAWIPGVNFAEWCQAVGLKKSHALWLLFPIVNIFIIAGMSVDLVRSFRKMDFWHSALAVIYPPAMFALIAKNPQDHFVEPANSNEKEYLAQLHAAQKANEVSKVERLQKNSPYAKSIGREWIESIVFAVFAAAFLRMFILEAYVIPTPSMEGSLKVGDFLLVSKVHYGIRTPMTVAMLPLLHNTVPVIGGESYFSKPSLPYYRLPALTPVKRNDPFVFNWPVGDSVYLGKTRSWAAFQIVTSEYAKNDCRGAKLIVRPVDKKDHYIKRCVGMPGDSVQVIDRQLYINGKPGENPTHMEYMYAVRSTSTKINLKKLADWGINIYDPSANSGYFFLDQDQYNKVKSMGSDIEITPVPMTDPSVFPSNQTKWNFDNYGPIWIPAKGATVALNLENLPLFSRCISVYEHNTLVVENGQIIINGQPSTTYTFQQNYYWAMGDNRHNSEDSRAWGYVPEDHIVGKPLVIWFSLKNASLKEGINWKRIFTSANAN